MICPRKTLRFVWWNLQSFAHFEPALVAQAQWPSTQAAYEGKCQRVDAAIHELFPDGAPEVLAFGEITYKAAVEMRDRLFPTHDVLSLDLGLIPEMQVAVLYNKGVGTFEAGDPIVVPFTPRGTRPRAVIDYLFANHRVRFIACHWTARSTSMIDYEQLLTKSLKSLEGSSTNFNNADRDLQEEIAVASKGIEKVSGFKAGLALDKIEEDEFCVMYHLLLTVQGGNSADLSIAFRIDPKGYPILTGHEVSLRLGKPEKTFANRDEIRTFLAELASNPDSPLVVKLAFMLRRKDRK